ncbi:MAG: ArsR/SmtB family transcription factor [Acidimicrobiales bacterium]
MTRTVHRASKDQLYAALASAARAMGNGHRAEIVDVLAQGERSVDSVAHEIGQSVANTSHHLRLLSNAGLLESRRNGQRIIYRVADDRVIELWSVLREVASTHVGEVESAAAAYLGSREDIQSVTAEELAERVARGKVVLLDVRPEAEFEAGHIPGARSAPICRLVGLIDTLPKRREIVAYCRGPYCVYADQAVRLLRQHGRRASRLDVGLPDWRRAGRPVEPPVAEELSA